MRSIDEQCLILYDHNGSELYKYNINDFFEKIDSEQYNGTEVIMFNGFSSNNEYLWGGLAYELDIGVYFSIKIETGEIIVYGTNNHDKYNELLDEFPYNRQQNILFHTKIIEHDDIITYLDRDVKTYEKVQ